MSEQPVTAERASTPREERALVFALHEHMLSKLRENRGKRHWLGCSPQFLITKLREEVDELEQAVGGYLEEGSAEARDVWREAGDVGNFAAMVAENTTGPVEAAAREPEAVRLLRDLVQHWDAGDIDHDYDSIAGSVDAAREYVQKHGGLAGEHQHPDPASLEPAEELDVERLGYAIWRNTSYEPDLGRFTMHEDDGPEELAKHVAGDYLNAIPSEYARLQQQAAKEPTQ